MVSGPARRLILNLDTRWRGETSFTPRPLASRETVPLGKTLYGRDGKFERFGKMKNFMSLAGNEPKSEVIELTAESVHSVCYVIMTYLVTDMCTC